MLFRSRGDVRVAFENQTGESFSMDMTIPANTTAVVYLPYYRKNQKVVLNGHPVTFRQSGSFVVVDGVGSGTSRFEVQR